MNDIAISARGLGKRYKRLIRSEQHDSVRDIIGAKLGGMFTSKAKRDEQAVRNSFWALSNADFDIKRGENVGIIGLNGAGKSTLLKLLSRITVPTTGVAQIHGRLGALLEVGTGFHHELTGRENVFLYGSILGMGRKEVEAKFDAMIEFAEIAEFIDVPVKRYSSGMYVRLAFAVAAHLDPDILLLDEVLAVGDFAFQRKCMNFARQLEQKGSTILFVSHNMFSIKNMCQRVIYLKKGQIVYDGPTTEGLKLYEDDSRLADAPWFKEADENRSIQFTDVQILGEAGLPSSVFNFGERMTVRLKYKTNGRVTRPDFRIGLDRDDDIQCTTFSTMSDGIDIPFVEGEGVIELKTPPIKLVSDLYVANIVVRDAQSRMICAQIGGHFHVKHPILTATAYGVYHEAGDWRMSNESAGEATAEAPRMEALHGAR